MSPTKVLSADATVVTTAAVAWTDVLHSFLEWGVLILGFVSGLFALYWHIKRWRKEREQSD